MFRRLLREFRWGVLPIPGRSLAIIFFIFLFIFPLIFRGNYPLLILTLATIYTIFAVSWDLVSGYTGQVSFGHALFFGLGAYGSALLYKYAGLPPAATIPIGAIGAAVIGVALCLPALRLRGPYLSLFTMALPLLLTEVVRAFPEVTGGYVGIRDLPRLVDSRMGEYYVCLIVMTVSVLIMWKLSDAGSKYVRTGLIFHAIREDEIAARASGINTMRYKILAFAVGGLFAGIAGALYPHIRGTIGPTTLSLTTSFLAVIWTIFGGIVSIYGPVVGVYILYPLVYLSLDIRHFFARAAAGARSAPLASFFKVMETLAERPYLVLGVIVILVLLFMPEGLAVRIRDKIERRCPRCKLINAAWRRECRACSASLH